MGRRASREIAMKLLYQLEIQKDNREEQVNSVLEEHELNESDVKYINEVVIGVQDNMSYIDEIIEKYSKGWKINRISKVDLSILRLSIFEISYRDDIPFNVSINEAVELAKKYSGEESGAFVNGILGKVSQVRLISTDTVQDE
ncbi:MAG: transcription antitermination factor NusB [Clostridia bacterium]|nr:transcription antitermination factor NusB [Clostridia bacterium]